MKGYCSMCGEYTTLTSIGEEYICEQCREDLESLLSYGKEYGNEHLQETSRN